MEEQELERRTPNKNTINRIRCLLWIPLLLFYIFSVILKISIKCQNKYSFNAADML